MIEAAASIAHIIAQTQSNISFLQEQGHLSQTEAAKIQTQLAAASASAGSTRRVPSPPVFTPPARHVPAPPAMMPIQRVPTPPVSPPSAPGSVQARALWAYNENGAEPNDLIFAVGEIIEIVSEDNADWWTGRARGREGLFPSNYVEKLGPEQQTKKRAYKPFMAAHHGADVPAPADSGVTNSVGLQQDNGQEQKKSKYGQFGNTMAHSAAGGVGFGAGAAIGGGLVRAIF